MKKFYSILVCVCLGVFVQAQTAKNMTLVGQATFPENLNDVWGWVDDSTNVEYALVGRRDGVSIVDLSNPANPTEVQFIPGAFSHWRDLKTWQHYAYVTNEDSAGVLIIDMSGTPGNWGYKDTEIGGITRAHNLYIDDGVAYVVASNRHFGGIVMFDIATDPWNPVEIGFYDNRRVHDVYVRDKIAYAAGINDGLLEIIDVSDPMNPVVTGSQAYQNAKTHNTWLNDSSTVCFTTDELSDAYIYAWDITDPSNIVELGRIRSSLSNGTATPHNVHVLNDFLVTSYYADGIHIVDAARPHNLVEVGYYDTNSLTGGGTTGMWGAYPFLPSGLIIGTDMNTGLFVWQPEFERACYLEGMVTDTVTGQPLTNARIQIVGASLYKFADNTGGYAMGIADSGSYTVRYSKFGYFPKTFALTLNHGQLIVQDVELVPVPTLSTQLTVLDSASQTGVANAKVIFTSNGQDFNYVAGANGIVQASLPPATYTVYAGEWGWKTKEESITVDITGPNTGVIELATGYYDDFLFDFGWTTYATAFTGHWIRDVPIATTYSWGFVNPNEDVPDDFGNTCYVTGNGVGLVGEFDVDDGDVELTSPAMDLQNYTNPTIKLFRWFANEGSFEDDEMTIELTDGNTTQVLTTLIGSSHNRWVEEEFSVLEFFPNPTANMKLIVTTGDQFGSGHLVEGGLDHFQVVEGGPLSRSTTLDHSSRLSAAPNPFSGSTRIAYELSPEHVSTPLVFEVRDLQGRLIESRELRELSGAFEWNTQADSGVYFGVIRAGDRVVQRIKLVRM